MAFRGLELGKISLSAHQTAIDVTGHNVSNASTEGYSRQSTDVTAVSMNHEQYGTFGTGSQATGVLRARDSFVDDTIMREQGELYRWDVIDSNMTYIQDIMNEPSDYSIRAQMDQLLSSFSDLSNMPEDMSIRTTVKENADALASLMIDTYGRLETVRDTLNDELSVEVENINGILKEIAAVNETIQKTELDRHQANDLRDKRDLLTEQLSKLVDIKVSRGREYAISIDGRAAVQGADYSQLETARDYEDPAGKKIVRWVGNTGEVNFNNGKIAGIIDLRDNDIRRFMDDLDELTIGIVDVVNEQHRFGFDLDGNKGGDFYKELSTYPEQVDKNEDGILEAAIYKVGSNVYIADTKTSTLDSSPLVNSVSGTIRINYTEVNYDTSVDSLEDIVNKINNLMTDASASISPENKLVIRGGRETNYVIDTIEDVSGDLFQQLGILNTGATKFESEDVATLANLTLERMAQPKSGAAKNITLKIDNPVRIAASKGQDNDGDGIPDVSNGPGDGSNIIELSRLDSKKSVGKYTYGEFFSSMIADLGVKAKKAKTNLETQNLLVDNLSDRRESTIGVSVDEEVSNLMMFQRGYQAISKFIGIVDSLYDSLLSM